MALTPLSSLEKIRTDETVDDQPAQFGDYGDLKNIWHLNIKTLWKMLNWSVGLSDGQLLIGKTIGNVTRAVKAQLTGANGVKITNGPGSITVGLDTFGGAARLLVSDSSGVPRPVAMSGDVSIDASGHTTVNSTTAPVNAQPATTSVQGVVEMSVAPVSSATPIAVGDNDPRMSDTRTPTDGSVTTAKLQANAVTTAKIAASAVGTDQIADGSITSAKLAAGVGGGSGGGGTTTPATTTALGLVELADTPTTASAPKALITESASVTSAANKLVRAGSDGKIDAGWLPSGSGGGTSGVSSINAKTNAVIVTGTGGITIAATTNGFAVDGSGITGGAGAATPTDNYKNAILAETSLVGYWMLNEPSGTTATDSSTGGHNGTYNSTAGAIQNGIPGPLTLANNNRASYFDGSSNAQIVVTPGSWLPSAAQSVTVECWFNSYNNGGRSMLAFGDSGGGQCFSMLMLSNLLYLHTFNGSGTTNSTGSYVPLGEWVHGAITYDGSTVKVYVNGVLAGQTNGVTLTTGSAFLHIGGPDIYGGYINWLGLLAHVSICNTALPQSNLITHFLAGRP